MAEFAATQFWPRVGALLDRVAPPPPPVVEPPPEPPPPPEPRVARPDLFAPGPVVFVPLTTGLSLGPDPIRVIPHRDPDTVIARDGLPLPPERLWRGYGTNEKQYLDLATGSTRSLLRICGEAGFRLEDGGKRVLDFGCAAGPMLRCLAAHATTNELWGSDIDADCIDWCRRHLPMFRFFTNTTGPHLPFEDRTFDLVYCGSVFTHITECADAWLLELARILKPGGLLYASIHDQRFIESVIELAPDWHFTKQIVASRPTSEFAQFVLGSGFLSNVFYDRDYFVKVASAAFDLVAAHDRAYGKQSVMLLRRR